MMSAGVRLLPLWNVTPLRIVKAHVAAPFDGSMASTTSATMLPLASTSVRLFDMPPQNGTCVAVSGYPAGSPVSVVAPCARPNFAEPPFFGSAATPASASSDVASAVVTPSAAARPKNSRRLIFPLAICWVQYSSSVIDGSPCCVHVPLAPSGGPDYFRHDLEPGSAHDGRTARLSSIEICPRWCFV